MSKAKLLLCQRCRSKKIKCNFEYPCANCVNGNFDCVKIVDDLRKNRPAVNYVRNLEKAHTQLVDLFKQFNSLKTIEEKTNYLKSVDLPDMLNRDFEEGEISQKLDYSDLDNDAAVYGPTSIYDDELISKNIQFQSEDSKELNRFNKRPDILQCLKLFFVWQYPDLNMFIFREAFLQEFFKPKFYNIYCSKVLTLSICALGARMSDDEKIYNKSLKFYNEAKSLLLNKLNTPSITSLQSYLLLAFYDIFNGSNSSGWMLSGNAIRMGFDLGFQLHPNSWFLKKASNYSKEIDNEIKSRIYWGTYLSDHFISLILGRPSLLKLSDATIPETDDLPELEWIDEYRYLSEYEKSNLNTKKVSNISDPLKNVINLINISDNMLNDVFNKNFNQDIKDLKSTSDFSNLHQILQKLNEYNEKIFNWKRDLPADLQFDQTTLRLYGENPTSSCIRYYYYILILCLNRPFIGLDDDFFQNFIVSPKTLCVGAINDLYVGIGRFQEVHGLKKASVFIVYCSILSISIILLINDDIIENKRLKLRFFLVVLKETSRTWNLAKKSFINITSKLSNYDIDFNLDALDEPDIKVEEKLDEVLDEQILGNSIHLNDLSMPATNSSSNSDLEFFGGPPMLMTSDLFNQEWESLFPDSIFNEKNVP